MAETGIKAKVYGENTVFHGYGRIGRIRVSFLGGIHVGFGTNVMHNCLYVRDKAIPIFRVRTDVRSFGTKGVD